MNNVVPFPQKRSSKHPVFSGDDGWVTVPHNALGHIPLGDLVEAYEAVGLRLRLQVKESAN